MLFVVLLLSFGAGKRHSPTLAFCIGATAIVFITVRMIVNYEFREQHQMEENGQCKNQLRMCPLFIKRTLMLCCIQETKYVACRLCTDIKRVNLDKCVVNEVK